MLKTGLPLYIWNPRWAIEDAHHDYNKGQVTLAVMYDVFNTGR